MSQMQMFTAQIDPSGLSDVPAKTDAIGFAPYTRAIGWFLSNSKTKAPLTISIEGPWGSGKSSFMLQLQEELKKDALDPDKISFVWFNAWRSDKDEALWAAFALTFVRQLKLQVGFFKRIRANVRLLWSRLDWQRGWFQLLKLAAIWMCFAAISIYALNHLDLVTSSNVGAVGFGIPWVAALLFGFREAKKIVGDPFSADLSKYLRNLQYVEKVAFIDRFQDDFADIVTNYIGPEGKVFVFIDDLDRCEVPRAAELLQAINLLMSTDQGNLFFILGLDREMVAAGIAAKNEKILPYLAAAHASSSYLSQDSSRVGIEYGFSFMEKFVQVPFRIPSPSQREIGRWVTNMATGKTTPETSAASGIEEIQDGSDPAGFELVTEKIAQLFDFNPRRVKQFINILRLRVMIALSTGVLVVKNPFSAGGANAGGITMEQLGLLTAILMRWPQLSSDLIDDPTLLKKIAFSGSASAQSNTTLDRAARWSSDGELRQAIDLDPVYSLSNVDLTPILMIMPSTYAGTLGRRTSQDRTQLVSGLTARAASGPIGPDPDANTGNFSGPTGPRGPSETPSSVRVSSA